MRARRSSRSRRPVAALRFRLPGRPAPLVFRVARRLGAAQRDGDARAGARERSPPTVDRSRACSPAASIPVAEARSPSSTTRMARRAWSISTPASSTGSTRRAPTFRVGSGFATRDPVPRRRDLRPGGSPAPERAAGARPRARAGGPLPECGRDALGDADAARGPGPSSGRRVGPRLGIHDPRVPAGSRGAPRPARRRRPRVRQARRRPVRRPLPGRVADGERDRRTRAGRSVRSAVPRGATRDRPRPCRARRAQPGGVDHAARRLARPRDPLPRRFSRAGGHRRRERPVPDARGGGRDAAAAERRRSSTRRSSRRARAASIRCPGSARLEHSRGVVLRRARQAHPDAAFGRGGSSRWRASRAATSPSRFSRGRITHSSRRRRGSRRRCSGPTPSPRACSHSSADGWPTTG